MATSAIRGTRHPGRPRLPLATNAIRHTDIAALTGWAAGDVTGGPQFVYVAAAQGSAAAANALFPAERAVDYAALPRVMFTSPAMASAGWLNFGALLGGAA